MSDQVRVEIERLLAEVTRLREQNALLREELDRIATGIGDVVGGDDD